MPDVPYPRWLTSCSSPDVCETESDRAISSIRIRIEHTIGGVKRYRIVKDKIRLLKDGIRDTIMETCCGLHNFRLQYRPWDYAN